MQLSVVTGKCNRWLTKNYGSRRGFARTYWHRFRYYFGAYRQYKDINWQTVERLVFVCKGNICRSAYAEAVAKSLGVDAVSCGIDTIENVPANVAAVRATERKGLGLDGHKTQPVMYLSLKKTDLIIAMEPWQADFLKKYLMRDHQYTLLGLSGRNIVPHIQDPYGASDAYFDICFSCIQESVKNIVEAMSK